MTAVDTETCCETTELVDPDLEAKCDATIPCPRAAVWRCVSLCCRQAGNACHPCKIHDERFYAELLATGRHYRCNVCGAIDALIDWLPI